MGDAISGISMPTMNGRALGRPDPLLDEDSWYVTLGDNPQARASAYASRLEDSLPDHEWDR
ncbi:hypothetical protein, partial [Nitrospira sp. BLG_2]|uniref:hypothetical protein n=1 Tax=Nitrospira sp. BLG_2 TaxID=3397507 RepID=UPI003B9BDCE1